MMSNVISNMLPLAGRLNLSKHRAAVAAIAAEFDLQDPISSILSRIREFPSEIRLLIWGFCLCRKPIKNEGNSYTLIFPPNLIKALRPDPDLYQEALYVYYKCETFCLKATTFGKFTQLKVDALSRIQKLAINTNELSGLELLVRQAIIRDPRIVENLNWEFQRLFTDPFSRLTLLTNITHLELLSKAGYPLFYSLIPTLAKVCTKIKYLRIWIQPTVANQATERGMLDFVLKIMGKSLSFDRELADQTVRRRLSMDYRCWVRDEAKEKSLASKERLD